LKDKVFRNIDEVVAAESAAVDFYNNQRPHMSIGMLVPSEAINRNQQLEIPENCLLVPSSQPLTGIRLGK